MKIKAFQMKGSNLRGDRAARWYEASHPAGWIGVGRTPTAALLDMRHEYRQFSDSAEAGKCRQGRFHKA